MNTDSATRTWKQRVCQFSSLFLRERPRRRKRSKAGKEVKRRSAEKKHGTVAQWVFGDSCQVNVLDLSKLRSEKRHSAGRIEVLYRYTAIYFSNGRLTRILVIVNKLFCWEPIVNCRTVSWIISTLNSLQYCKSAGYLIFIFIFVMM